MNISLADLDGTNGFRLDGIGSRDSSGTSVASAGDVNGDGADDLIIGARDARPGYDDQAGESYVVFGNATGFGARLSLASLNGSNGFRIEGIDRRDFSGNSVASAGDVNGDGFDDVIIGAVGADPGRNSGAGASYVVFGRSTAFPARFDLENLNGRNGLQIDGIDRYDASGISVASAGDVNGDGFADLIIGAPNADPGEQGYAGESYVVFGKAGGFGANLSLADLNGTNGFRLDGIDPFDRSGRSVASAGDVNGDGLGDLIVGAYGGDPGVSRPNGGVSAGESYVVFGTRAGFAASLSLGALNGGNGFRIDGSYFEQSGISVASAGDVNGDGFDDVIIGAYTATPGRNSLTGASYVVFGKAGGFSATLSLADLDGSNGFRLDGIDDRDQSGRSVASAGDVNGDGFDDLIIGAPAADPGGRDSAGESYVVFGKAGGFAASLSLGTLDDSDGFQIDGIDAADQSGFSVASAGDVNGDGIDDLIIGANRATPGREVGAGESYVVFGFAAPRTLDGTAAAETLSAAGGNDRLTGGGGDDLLLGRVGRDTLLGGLGNDTLDGGSGGDRINGGAGLDLLSYSSAKAGVTADFARGLFREDGQDRDSVTLVEGAIGSAFADRLTGGTSAVTLLGGDGDDRIIGGEGADSLNGGAGDDVILDRLGAAQIGGGTGDDQITGSSSADRLGGDAGNDRVTGGSGDDTLSGGFGNDSLSGGADNDALSGGLGHDTLIGGTGNDTLTGDGGRDVFVFAAGFGQDRLTDFADGLDRLDFSVHTGVADFGDLTLAALGADVEIRDGAGGVLVLANTALGALSAQDFLF